MGSYFLNYAEVFQKNLAEVDPVLNNILQNEVAQQTDKLILVPSVSAAPPAVLQALGSAMQNVCAEGLPPRFLRGESSGVAAHMDWQLANIRRYADRRFYKGAHFVNLAESLAQTRCAEIFSKHAAESIDPDSLFVNVQSLSGGTANLAIYQALLNPGDTLMGMNLHQGGHLSHGASLNLSGQLYNIVSYAASVDDGQLDYAEILQLARTHQPKLIVAGFTSFPWMPDWHAFRRIADEVGAALVADIAHTAGLVAAGVVPSPVGIADVVSLTMNKTMCGPRAAVVLCQDKQLAERIDQAIFPGMQGAPHPNKFAAIAVACEIAKTDAFVALQKSILANATALAQGLRKREIALVFGGTDTHLMTLDLKSIATPTGNVLYAEPAARILELAGIIVNKNAIPGDESIGLATGLRIGTPWMSQRGLGARDMDDLAAILADVLLHIHPFAYEGVTGLLPRGKIDLGMLQDARARVQALVGRAVPTGVGDIGGVQPSWDDAFDGLRIRGERAYAFLQQSVTVNLAELASGVWVRTQFLNRVGDGLGDVHIMEESYEAGEWVYVLRVGRANFGAVYAWLMGLSDGYVLFDDADVLRKVMGPVVIAPLALGAEGDVGTATPRDQPAAARDLDKTYFVGQSLGLAQVEGTPSPQKKWRDEVVPTGDGLRRTPLFAAHGALGARLVPFAGWEMPLRYAAVAAEHGAVRTAAGLFDVSHMGIFEFSGRYAAAFLDAIFSNYVGWLDVGRACYGFLLLPDGSVLDDALVYRLGVARYMMVVNAVNTARVWDWLNAVNQGAVQIDAARPWVRMEAMTAIVDLTRTDAGAAQLCNVALQGPASVRVLQELLSHSDARARLGQLVKNGVLESVLDGVQVWIARTGYTGEEWGFEIFCHPDRVTDLWARILETGAPYGVVPVGLAARDSLRIEAGLPLWGHELAGVNKVTPVEAGFGGYVKFHKPFFVGRDVLLARQQPRRVVRFVVRQARARMPQNGDWVLTPDGQRVGTVTSCSINAARQKIGLALIDETYTAGDQVTILRSNMTMEAEICERFLVTGMGAVAQA